MRPLSGDLIDQIVALYKQRGAEEYGGEVVSQLEHALQCATLAERNDGDETLVAAALLHDIGHLLGESGDDAAHETLAASFLSPAFSDDVIQPIRLHVRAKRFLCWVDDEYYDGLSPASRASLEEQGGPYDRDEATAFGALPHAERAIKLRIFDDQAKVPGQPTPDLAHFLDVLRRVAL